jgi:hypothetical protein
VVDSIAIFGDSWGVSAWKSVLIKPDCYAEHTGNLRFEGLFEKFNIQADNYSRSSISNQEILKNVKSTVFTNNKIYDCYIIIQTDPLRDFFECNYHGCAIEPMNDVDQFGLENLSDLDQVSEKLSEQFYLGLSEIQKKIDRIFLLVGGLSKLHYKSIPSNLHYITPSWTELICKDKSFEDCYYENMHRVLKINELLRKKLNWKTDSIKLVFDIEKQIDKKQSIWKNSEDFSLRHPSDSGFLPMFELIHSTIKRF